ncbi:MAG: methyltransferase domain-containing protein [Clostridia bacterium]
MLEKQYNASEFVCPKCHKALAKIDGALICADNHCYDIAREGYVNLLLPNKKNSLAPGDNKTMVVARKNFLDKDFYLPLATKVAEIVNEFAPQDITLLDSGCGSGYYLSHIAGARARANDKFVAIDISKEAVKLASKSFAQGGRNQCAQAEFAVASSYDLPLADKSCDCVVSIFSPYALEEFERVLTSGGLLFVISSAKHHLWELKKILYGENIYEKQNNIAYAGWSELRSGTLTFAINLQSQDDIANLLAMTPFAYTTSQAQKQKLAQLNELETTVDFEIKIFKKTK